MPVVAAKHQHTEHAPSSHVESQHGAPSPSPDLCRDGLALKAVRVLESDLNELERARMFVRSACSSLPATIVSEEVIDQLELALTEAVTNVIRHAYHECTGQSILLEAEANDEQIVFRLYHHGDTFDPPPPTPPIFDGYPEHGFGLYIIRECVTCVTYTQDDEKGNGIFLMKRLQPEKGNTEQCNS